jgi:hypothetical protein
VILWIDWNFGPVDATDAVERLFDDRRFRIRTERYFDSVHRRTVKLIVLHPYSDALDS